MYEGEIPILLVIYSDLFSYGTCYTEGTLDFSKLKNGQCIGLFKRTIRYIEKLIYSLFSGKKSNACCNEILAGNISYSLQT